MRKLSIVLGVVLWIGLTSLTFQNTPAVPKPVDYTTCVRIFDKGMSGMGQRVLQFYNGCQTDLYFSACVSDSGQSQTYTSPRYVMTNGYWTIWAPPFVNPKSVKWAAGPSPVEPPDCG